MQDYRLKGIVQDTGQINNAVYKYTYCNTFGLLMFCSNNVVLQNSLKNIMISHRRPGFEIYNFVLEEFFCMNEKIPLTVNYLLIHTDDEIVGISRIMYNEENSIGVISAVHTSLEHRGKKVCQLNIGKLVELTRTKYKIKRFELGVDITNRSAIKCYKNIGFEIYGDIKHYKNSDDYQMKLDFNVNVTSSDISDDSDIRDEVTDIVIVGGNYNNLYDKNKKIYDKLKLSR